MVNLSGSGLMAARMIPDLEMADEVDLVADLGHQVAIRDLYMVNIEE